MKLVTSSHIHCVNQCYDFEVASNIKGLLFGCKRKPVNRNLFAFAVLIPPHKRPNQLILNINPGALFYTNPNKSPFTDIPWVRSDQHSMKYAIAGQKTVISSIAARSNPSACREFPLPVLGANFGKICAIGTLERFAPSAHRRQLILSPLVTDSN